jgi:hypothetical protein
MNAHEFKLKMATITESFRSAKLKIDQESSLLSKEYFESNSDIKVGSVYELIPGANTTRRLKLKRFCVYQNHVEIFCGEPILIVAGWWLNKLNTPAKWGTLYIDGVSNPVYLQLSPNQDNNPVPVHIKTVD